MAEVTDRPRQREDLPQESWVRLKEQVSQAVDCRSGCQPQAASCAAADGDEDVWEPVNQQKPDQSDPFGWVAPHSTVVIKAVGQTGRLDSKHSGRCPSARALEAGQPSPQGRQRRG